MAGKRQGEPEEEGRRRSSRAVSAATVASAAGAATTHDGGASQISSSSASIPAGMGPAGRELSDYRDGSIISIKVANFVTYDSCQFFPGPNLNMIIGPNGSGKSTIVCAIALGLGGPPSLLGRAKEICEFVKHGHDKAIIEIELKRASGRNLVIRRSFKKSENTSEWRLNGSTATFASVQQNVKALNVQVENLCQFLPQDKVSEFAQMDPPKLLKETEKAVGEANMIEMHNRLIELRRQEVQDAAANEDLASSLKTLEARNAVLERDVIRFRERERHTKMIEILERKLPWVAYNKAREDFIAKKDARTAAVQARDALMRQTNPINNKIAELQSKLKKLEAERMDLRKAYNDRTNTVNKVTSSIETANQEVDDIQYNISNIATRKKEHEKKLAQLRAEIEKLENQLKREPPNDDHLAKELQKVNEALRTVFASIGQIQAEIQEIHDVAKSTTAEMNTQHQALQSLSDIRNRKLVALRNIDRDAHAAVTWLRNNRDKFQDVVFDPVCIELNLKDPRYANIVETQMSSHILTSFVCVSSGDYKMLMDELVDKQKLRINAVLVPEGKRLSDFRPPFSVEEIRKHGFEDYIINLIDGPEPVLATLCQLSNLHNIPVSLKDVNRDWADRVGSIHRYVSKNVSYNLRQSRYGNKQVTITTMGIRPCRVLNNSVNAEDQNRIQERIAELNRKLQENEARSKEVTKRDSSLRQEDGRLRAQKDEIANKRKEIQKEIQAFRNANLKLDSKKKELENEQNGPSLEAEEANLRQRLRSASVKKGKFVLEYRNHTARLLELFRARTKTQLHIIHLSAVIQKLEEENRLRNEAIDEARLQADRAEQEFKDAKQNAVNLLAQAKSKGDPDEETRKAFQELPDDVDGINAKIAEHRASIDAQYEANPTAIQEYEKRCKEIEALKQKAKDIDNKLTKIRGELQTVKDAWYPKLQDIVKSIGTSFSASFERMGCAGDVRIAEDDDYDKWGIEILVKFRDTEPLQTLTGQRQSGGERSVSTILYLMALQQYTKAPFRVVDEINQGMDPRNERMVHAQIVETACQTNTSQYFLITPKLLPDLTYHERMRVLCVYNGDWNSSHSEWNVAQFIQRRKG